MSLEEEVHRLKAKAAAERGRVAQAQGDLEAASYFYAHSLEWADTPEARVGQAQALSYEGKLDQAMAECKKAIALDPEQGQAYNDIGVYLMQRNQPDQAIPWLEKAKIAPRYEPRQFPYINLGHIYAERGELFKAISEFEGALRQAPEDERIRRHLEELKSRLN